MDDETAVDNAARRIGQSDRDKEAEVLFDRIMHECNDIAKLRRGLKVARIYIGQTEFNTLRAWTGIHRWYHREQFYDTIAGHPFYRTDQMEHLYIAWE